MIIPVRCFTCGKVLAGKWRRYCEAVEEDKAASGGGGKTKKAEAEGDASRPYFDDGHKARVLAELGVDKICCRRHLLTHVDLVDLL